jgi:hypothetical protein
MALTADTIADGIHQESLSSASFAIQKVAAANAYSSNYSIVHQTLFWIQQLIGLLAMPKKDILPVHKSIQFHIHFSTGGFRFW